TISNRRPGRARRLTVLAVGLALAATACGGDDDDADTGDTSAATDAPADDTAGDTAADETGDATGATTTADAGGDTAEPSASGEPFQVAVVAPSTRNDLAWTQALADGLDALVETHGLEIAFSENMFVVEDAGVAL